MSESIRNDFEKLGLEQDYQAKIIHRYEDLFETLIRHDLHEDFYDRDTKLVSKIIRGVTMHNPKTEELEFHRDLALQIGATPKDAKGYKRCAIELMEAPSSSEFGDVLGELWFSYNPSSGKIKAFKDMMPEARMFDWEDVLTSTNREMDRRLHNGPSIQ